MGLLKLKYNRLVQQAYYRSNLFKFTYDLLGWTLYSHHERWLKVIENHREPIILSPRGHGKSKTITYFYILHKICCNRNIRILFISESLNSNAMQELKLARHELEYNDKLISVFGKFRDGDVKWTDTDFEVIRDKQEKELTLKAVGVDTAVTGGHYDLIICDDILSYKNTRTEAQRQKTKEWFFTSVNPLLLENEDARLIIIGTPKHYDDLYATLEKTGIYYVHRDKAVIEGDIYDNSAYDYKVDDEGNIIDIIIYKPENYKLLWPEYWTLESILKKKKVSESMPGLFDSEYQCQIVSRVSSVFQLEWLNKAKDENLSYKTKNEFNSSNYKYIIQSWDLGIVDTEEQATKGDSSYTVGLTFGIDENWNKYLIDMYRVRGITPVDLRDMIIQKYYDYGADAVIIENNAFQQFLVGQMRIETDLHIYPHTTGKNKSNIKKGVIPVISIQLQNNKLRFPYKTIADQRYTDIIINELYKYGHEKHNDTVMSLWFALYFLAYNETMRKSKQVSVKNRPKSRRKR